MSNIQIEHRLIKSHIVVQYYNVLSYRHKPHVFPQYELHLANLISSTHIAVRYGSRMTFFVIESSYTHNKHTVNISTYQLELRYLAV